LSRLGTELKISDRQPIVILKGAEIRVHGCTPQPKQLDFSLDRWSNNSGGRRLHISKQLEIVVRKFLRLQDPQLLSKLNFDPRTKIEKMHQCARSLCPKVFQWNTLITYI